MPLVITSKSNINMDEPPPPASLLDLPDKALLTVLRCLAADRDLTSLLSAARAHSTLHKLSAAALTSIDTAATQQQVASLQLYLARHGQHVSSLQLRGYFTSDGSDSDGSDNLAGHPVLDELPQGLQLHRLSLTDLRLQLLPGGGRTGMLQAGAPLRQLEFTNCAMRDSAPDSAFAQVLFQLPQLQHIKYANWGSTLVFPGHVLSAPQQLTSLDVIHAPGDVLEFVHLAPRLRDLKARLGPDSTGASPRRRVSFLQHLTSLELWAPFSGEVELDVAGLANINQLQRLRIDGATLADEPAGVAALLSELQQMTQLTHLALPGCLDLGADDDPSRPPAAAYAALAASSTLQHLDVSGNTMPQGVWQHVLPANRQLPQLRVLNASQCGMPGCWTHADIARLASCCPNLQELGMRTPEPLAADTLQLLRDLAALTALEAGELDDSGLAAVAELTQLLQLRVWKQESATDAGLLQLTQLRQLTDLVAFWEEPGADIFECKRPEDEPVWRQVLQHSMKSEQPGVVELA